MFQMMDGMLFLPYQGEGLKSVSEVICEKCLSEKVILSVK